MYRSCQSCGAWESIGNGQGECHRWAPHPLIGDVEGWVTWPETNCAAGCYESVPEENR